MVSLCEKQDYTAMNRALEVLDYSETTQLYNESIISASKLRTVIKASYIRVVKCMYNTM